MDKMNGISQVKWAEICALKIDMFETHVNHLKNQLEIIKNDKDYSDEQIKMLKDELVKAQKVLDSFHEEI